MFAQPIDPRVALQHAIALQQLNQGQVNHPMVPPRAQTLSAMQQMAQALAVQVARQRQPLGKARVPGPRDRIIDGGVPGAEPAFRHSAGYRLRAGMGVDGALNTILPQLLRG